MRASALVVCLFCILLWSSANSRKHHDNEHHDDAYSHDAQTKSFDAENQDQHEKLYKRPDKKRAIMLDDPQLLAKQTHEQIHLALAGPGRIAISWVTSSYANPELIKEVEALKAAKRHSDLVSENHPNPDSTSKKNKMAKTSIIQLQADAVAKALPTLPVELLQPEKVEEKRIENVSPGIAPSPQPSSGINFTFSDHPNISGRKLSKKKYKKDRCNHLKDFHLKPTVAYWIEGQDIQDEVTGHFSCYSSSDYFSGALHTVVIGDEQPLNASTKYFYKVGDHVHGFSDVSSFIMVPDIGPQSYPYRLGLIGDLGQTDDSRQTLAHLDALNVTTVLNVGDLSYADDFQPRWDSWSNLLEFHASKIPWMHIEGNVYRIFDNSGGMQHEQETIDGVEGFVAYEERFYFPAIESGSNSPFYYSYETGPAHVIMLGCYVDYSENSAQVNWLVKDLAKVDRSRTPWLIVGMHAPWYNSNQAHNKEMDSMQESMEEILYNSNVDLVFAGHVHAYEISSGGLFRNKTDPCGPVYIVIGDGGNREGLAEDYLPKPEWSGVREASFGMGILDFQNDTHAVWQWHRNMENLTQIGDEYQLVRNSLCTAPEAAFFG